MVIKTLFLENYKGYKRVFLPLVDVNFFVGENSSGKTAVLNLLYLIHQPDFWLSGNLNSNEVELGYFEEIINKFSNDLESFSIGLEVLEQPNETLSYFKFRYVNKKGTPVLDEMQYLVGDKTVLIKYFINKKNGVSYKIKDFKKTSFEQWISNDDSWSGFKRLSISKDKSLYQVRTLLEEKLRQLGIRSDTRYSFFFTNFSWIAPIRAKPQRYYESFSVNQSSDGAHIPVVLHNLFQKASNGTDLIIRALEKFGKNSNLFDSIKIARFSKQKGSPFEIDVTYNSMPIKITNVGYGVSQIMPVLVELLITKGELIAIQQPEVHLHPKAQAAFGEFIFDNCISNRNRFVMETHSDYTINRFRYLLHKSQRKSLPQAQVIFFERTDNGTMFQALPILPNGRYPDDLPSSFGEFFMNEELRLLEI